ncbi:MAG: hypothetical protein SV910_08395 [Chloroflexota bacterium]|nr:hypothetical protein [Chloroflexota bacterium]
MMFFKRRVWLHTMVWVQVALILLIAGVGAAFALSSNPLGVSGTTGMYPANTTITDAANLSVDQTKPTYFPGYKLIFDSDMSDITAIEVYVANGDSSAHDGMVEVSVYNGSFTELDSVRSAEATFGASSTTTVTLSLSGVTSATIATIHIVLYETS